VTDETHKKSTNFITGLAIGTAVAAGAAFLYKTRKGKKLRKNLEENLDDAKGFLAAHLEDVKKKAKKLESQMSESSQEVKNPPRSTRKKLTKKVFSQSGKPLAK